MTQMSYAQYTYDAIVTDSVTHEPLTGAVISESGTSNASAADVEGKVKLIISKTSPVVIEINYIGYKSKAMTVSIP